MKHICLLLFSLLFAVNNSSAQEISPEIPFPKSPGAKMVVQLSTVFPVGASTPFSNYDKNDTSLIFYFDKKGNATIRYRYSAWIKARASKDIYRYDNNSNLIEHSSYKTTGEGNQLDYKLDENNLTRDFTQLFFYNEANQLIKGQWIEDDTLVEETNYFYENGKLLKIIPVHKPRPGTCQFHINDSSTFIHDKNIEYKIRWEKEGPDTLKTVREYQNDLLVDDYIVLADGKIDWRTKSTYNGDKLLVDQLSINSLPLYTEQNILMRSNRTKYYYNKKKWLVRKSYYADKLLAGEENFIYK